MFRLFFLLTFATSALAHDVYVNCTNLVDGNYTKNSRETIEEISFSLLIDPAAKEVSFRGYLIQQDGFKKTFTSDLRNKSQFRVSGTLVETNDHFRKYTECGREGEEICHVWKSFSYDVMTNTGTYNEAEAKPLFARSQEVRLSLKFSCH